MSYKRRAIDGIVVASSLVIMAGVAQNADIAVAETITTETEARVNLPMSGYAGIVAELSVVEEEAYDNFMRADINIQQSDVVLVGTAEKPLAGVTEALAATGESAITRAEESVATGTLAEVPAAIWELPVEEETAGAETPAAADEVLAAEEPTVIEVADEASAAEEPAIIDAAEEESVAAEGALVAEEESASEELVWESRLMADVNDFLYIRAEGNEDAEIMGKLYKGDVAEIVEYGEEWTHVTSGNVDGYVKNSYCLFGADALTYATENFDMEAEIQTNGLRVRSEASEDARVLTAVSTGMSLTVDTDAEEVDGWVAVVYKGDTAYVSAEYVTVDLALGEAVTIEEERAAQARAAAQAAAAAQVPSSGTVQNAPVAASVDDVTLLAALIQCEAGNEPYEGQLAVGAVVMNRVRSGGYPNSVYGVIYQSGQFSPARSGSVARVAANGPKASCVQAAQEALAGADNTGGATCFRPASSGRAGILIGNQVFW